MGILSRDEPFHPVFLRVIDKTGHFAMGSRTYQLFSTECLVKTKKLFETWIEENGLKLTEKESGFYIIEKKK